MAAGGIGGIAAGLMASAGEAKKAQSSGVIGGMIEAATGQIKDYNDAVEAATEAELSLKEAVMELTDVEDRLSEIEKLREGHLNPEQIAEYEKEVAKLTETEKELTKAKAKANDEYLDSKSNLDALQNSSGKMNNALTVMATKVTGVVTAYFSWSKMLDSIDKRLQLAAKSVGDLGVVTDGYGDSISAIYDETKKWNEVINETNMEMAHMGYSVDDTTTLMANLSDNLRLTTNNQQNLAKDTGQLTQDIGHMAKLLRVNTEELADASIVANKKFGKSAGGMADSLAGMYDGLKEIKFESKGAVVHLGDLTRATLDTQASFQGYNLNLRETAKVMGNVAAKAQEQGATYEMSMKAAKGLTDILAGGGAPDWAKYVAGDKLLDEMKKTSKAAAGTMDEYKVALREQMGEKAFDGLSEDQIKGMKNLSQNYKKYGKLSASYMAEELLRGTEMGNKQMFDLLKKHGSGHEGRELLKQVWGLDDAAATAATLALDTAKTYDDLVGIKADAEGAMAAKKPPTMADVKDQTKEFVNAMGNAEAGIVGAIANHFNALASNPFVTALTGGIGAVISGGMQVMGSGIAQGVVQNMLARHGVSGAVSAAKGAVGSGIGKIAGVGSSIVGGAGAIAGGAMSGLGAAGGAISSVAGGASLASTAGIGATATAAGGGAAGVASVAAPLAAAGAAGVALGYGMRKLSDKVEEWTDGTIPSVDTATQGLADGFTKHVNWLTGGFIDLRATIGEEEQMRGILNKQLKENTALQGIMGKIQKGVMGDLKEGSSEYMKVLQFLKDYKPEELEAFAKQISEANNIPLAQALEQIKGFAAKGQEQLGKGGASTDYVKFQEAAKKDKDLTFKNFQSMDEDARAKLGVEKGPTAKAVGAKVPKAPPGDEDARAKLGVEKGPTAKAVGAKVPKAPPGFVPKLSSAQKKAVTQEVAKKLGPEIAPMAESMFEQMSQQSTEFYENMTSVSNVFWQDNMVQLARDAWDAVVISLDEKLNTMSSPFTPLATAGGEDGTGMATSIGPDGSIMIQVTVPRNALDASNRQSAGYVE